MLADLVVLVHFAFIVFVIAGALLCAWRPWFAALHLPALGWAVYVEAAGQICPLTPLENELRRQAATADYSGSFIDHHVLPLIYPTGLTRDMQIAAGIALLLLNVAIYRWVWRRRGR